jgi:DNA-binding transcriptional MerR regulator
MLVNPTQGVLMDKRNAFSSNHVAKALNIEPERLRQWIRLGFVSPNTPAKGQGSRGIFTRGDVYSVELFRRLLDLGIARSFAASLSRVYSVPRRYFTLNDETGRPIEKSEEDDASEESLIEAGDILCIVFHDDPKFPEVKLLTPTAILAVVGTKILKKEQREKTTFEDLIASKRDLLGVGEWTRMLAVNLKKLRDEIDAGLPD